MGVAMINHHESSVSALKEGIQEIKQLQLSMGKAPLPS